MTVATAGAAVVCSIQLIEHHSLHTLPVNYSIAQLLVAVAEQQFAYYYDHLVYQREHKGVPLVSYMDYTNTNCNHSNQTQGAHLGGT